MGRTALFIERTPRQWRRGPDPTGITVLDQRRAPPLSPGLVANSVSVACLCAPYSPGIIKCAVDVPAFMIQTPPIFGLSGNPIDCVVAPGTATVICVRAVTWSFPR